MPANDVLDEVVEWSQSLPLWQRDALRRIVVQGELTDSDRDELLSICLDAHGLDAHDGPKPVPLAEEHLPLAPQGTEAVHIRSIADIQNVNALASDCVTFGTEGLTILYGENASGKSGFFRILRSCCRARAEDTNVLPNVLTDGPPSQPSARINYQVGPDARTTKWESGRDARRDLAAVSVFDRECASIYVNSENELAFRPLGLDVFDKLADTFDWLKGRLQESLNAADLQPCTALSAPPVHEGTKVAQLLEGLDAYTKPEDVNNLITLSSDEDDRLEQLQDALRDEPTVEAARLRAQSRRLTRLQNNLKSLEDGLSHARIKQLSALQQDAMTKRETADVAATKAFKDEPLPGVGTDTWRALWEAARRYAEEEVADPLYSFPFASKGERCVLCQQPLSEEAARRMGRFEQFVKADAERKALEAEQALQQGRSALASNTVLEGDINELIDELSGLNQALGAAIKCFFAAATQRRKEAERACDDGAWDDIPPLPESPREQLEKLLGILEARAKTLDAAASDETRAALVAEHHQLADRKWLRENQSAVLGEVNRLQTVKSLNEALRETDTTKLTNKSTELAKRIVSEALCAAFSRELKRLRAPYIDVTVSYARGRRGVPYHKVRLADAPDVPVGDVASEGEQTCIALAAFLAELSTAEDTSAIVLDDPVCSLDHARRRRVAERLVEEASKRQVIVFTHDIVFLHYLKDAATKTSQEYGVVSVRNVPSAGPGFCDAETPWEGANVNERIKQLKTMAKQARKLWFRDLTVEYSQTVNSLAAYLRKTWERAVEEVLFEGVVERFSPEVHTRKLPRVADIDAEDCRRVCEGMTTCSRLMHDQPRGGHEPAPEPQELYDAVDDLDSWCKEVRQRREAPRR